MTDDLEIVVRAKVREKWGGKPEDLPEFDDPPKLLGLRAAPVEALPQDLIQSIERAPMMNMGVERFMVVLRLNGCEIRLNVSLSSASIMAMKGPAARILVQEILEKSKYALQDVIYEALIKDLDRLHDRFGKAWLDGIG